MLILDINKFYFICVYDLPSLSDSKNKEQYYAHFSLLDFDYLILCQ